jgi:hypothetical protein
MSSPIPDPGRSPEIPPDAAVLLARRIQAIESVSEMASGNAAKLLDRTKQLEGSLNRLTEAIGPLPEPGRVDRLVKGMDSLQAMLDWLATRGPVLPGVGPGADLSQIQARLSMSRLALMDLESEIQRASALNAGVGEIRDEVASLASDLEALTSARDGAEALLCDARELVRGVELATEASANLDDPGREVLPGR